MCFGQFLCPSSAVFHCTHSNGICHTACEQCQDVPLTSALDGVDDQRHAPAAFPPGNSRYPLYRRLGESQCRSGSVRKTSPKPGFDRRTVNPVAGRYTD